MSNLVERALFNLQKRRMNIINGNINSIPSPFRRFKRDFIGFEQGSFLGISSFTKGSKTQFTLYMLFEAMMYVYEHQDQARIKIFYCPLEETDEKILNRFMSYILYRQTDGEIRISPQNLRSTDNDNPVDEEILNMFHESPYKEYLDFFNETFIFIESKNPTGILLDCVNYAKSHGTIHKRKYEYHNEDGTIEEREKFDYYEQDDEFEYRFLVIDHISLIDQERGETKKQSIDRMSQYCAMELRNKYNFTPIVIQQQSTANESIDAYKLDRTRPTKDGLADSKYTANDENILLGLYSPFKFNLKTYMGYDISKLKDNIRFLEVVVNRDGEMGGILPLYFDGAVCMFHEMPRPDDKEGMEAVYRKLDNIRKENNLKAKILYVKFLYNSWQHRIWKIFKHKKSRSKRDNNYICCQ